MGFFEVITTLVYTLGNAFGIWVVIPGFAISQFISDLFAQFGA